MKMATDEMMKAAAALTTTTPERMRLNLHQRATETSERTKAIPVGGGGSSRGVFYNEGTEYKKLKLHKI